MKRAPSIPGRDSISIPASPGFSRERQTGGRPQGSGIAYIEIDDDDDEPDELAFESVPCSSPYFTQATQIVGRTTQPTQIVNRATPQRPSSPPVPSTPGTVIEVPASSPFQPKSRPSPSVVLDRKPGAVSRVGSLMAPAGTSFRPPVMRNASHKGNGSTKRNGFINVSDDDLLEDYKRHDSSGDDMPTRGDIRPSSFVKRDESIMAPKKKSAWPLNADITLTEIRDVRLRHLTGQVYKIMQKRKPGITIKACKEALQKDVGWQVARAVDYLNGRVTKARPASKLANAPSASGSDSAGNIGDGSKPNPTRSASNTKTLQTSSSSHKSKNFSNSTTSDFPTSTQPSFSTSTQHSSSTSAQLSSAPKLKDSTRPTPSKGNLQRRGLVSQLNNTSVSSAIINLSSPTSSITSPTNSSPSHLTMTRTTSPSPSAEARPRRRLVRGRRNRTPSPDTTVVSASPDSANPQPSKKRPSASEDRTQAAKKQKTTDTIKKRKSVSEVYDLTSPPTKKQKASMDAIKKRKSVPEVYDLTAPPTKKSKTKDVREISSDDDSNAGKKHEAKGDLEEADTVEDLEDDDNVYGDASPEELDPELANVLHYLNTCTVETLSRMISSPPDAKLMVAGRPFKSIEVARKVFRQDKSKSKTKKTRRVVIGESIVEKLSEWMAACDAATTVIDECDKRGKEIRSAMSTWSMDNNGFPRKDKEELVDMPITKKPAMMSKQIELKDYQLVGLNWMNLLHSKGISGILGDDMGLGKTCQIISFIAHLVETGGDSGTRKPWPNLIVVPPSTYENWLAEFEKFAPEVSVMAYSGKERREIDPEDAREYHVVLTTYPQVEKQKEDLYFLQKIKPYAAIFDEGHRLKNQDTLIYRQMMRVPSKWRLIISGTPIQNNLKELLTVLHFIEPDLFGDEIFESLDKIFEAKVTNKDVLNFAALAAERVERARAVMAPFILRRLKEEVLDLPPKAERIELVGMNDTQKQIYDSIKGKYLLSNGVRAKKESHPWMQLRKAAIHHHLFRHHFTDEKVEEMVDILWKSCSEEELGVQTLEDRHKARFTEELMGLSDFKLHLWCKDFEKYIGHLDIPKGSWEDSPKVKKLLELVRGYMENGDRALVFTRFEMVVDILRETFHHAAIPICTLTGTIDTSLRFPEIEEFTNNPDIPVFVLTTVAGGTGLNLTAANKIIIFDQSDNPQDDVQASNRAHRIGQEQDVEVIRLITEKSVEGLIYNSCVKKLVLAARVERQFGAPDEDQESVEAECKRRMLLGDDEDQAAHEAMKTDGR
ncbi:SNF2 family N-terminal domain-containing protein [Hypoxylon sp. NC1633]|nr:SNF2 family N-terminal domain-containing protein [Hypoxylon sp. NC1633]